MRLFIILVSTAFQVSLSSSFTAKRQRMERIQTEDIHNITGISNFYGEKFASDVNKIVNWSDKTDLHLSPSSNLYLSQMTVLGNVILGDRIASSPSATIFSIVDHPDLVIKFQSNCLELDPVLNFHEPDAPYVHPLIRDYIFASIAGNERLGPEILYISAPGPLCESKAGKCDYKIEDEFFDRCKANPKAAVRYMIMEKINGPHLLAYKRRFKNGTVPFVESILIGYGLIRFLKELHVEAGIVHGDIHLTNLMLESISMKNATISLGLIDYGRSFYNDRRTEERIRESGRFQHHLFSMWELDGYISGARDDVARAVQVIAQLMNPWEYMDFEEWTSTLGPGAILDYKRNSDWFVLPAHPSFSVDGHDPVKNLGIKEEFKVLIRNQLDKILNLVRGMNLVNSVPPYDELLASLAELFSLNARGRLEQA